MRYAATTKNGLEMAFGFDHPLSEYFVQVYDKNDDLILDFNSSGMSMVSKPECNVPLSNSRIYEKITELMCDKDQFKYRYELECILLDLPF